MLASRVHLAVPSKDPLAIGGATREPSASVLLKYRGDAVPISEKDIRSLVAGAVTGLSPESVSVVTQQAAGSPAAPDQQLVRVGPVTTTRSSLTALKTLLGAGAVLNVLLAGAVLLLWNRLRRNRPERPLGALSPAEAQGKT